MKLMRLVLLPILVALLALAGCGSSVHTHLVSPIPPAVQSGSVTFSCPAAHNGRGAPGACAPKPIADVLGVTRAPRVVAPSSPLFEDLSNNDPCVCGTTLRAKGHSGLIVKANEGTYYVDPWAQPMADSARAAGLAIGAYDFDVYYSIAEVQLFVQRLHALGIFPNTPNVFPPYLDVEAGNFSYGGLLGQIAYLHQQGYQKIGIYTGDWYWGPHAGCTWPAGVYAWLSGYPSAPVPCGTTNYNAHQFTSTPVDLSAFLGSQTQFQAFVNALPPPDPFAIFPTSPVNERYLILHYLGALRHPVKYANYLRYVLEPQLGFAAHRIAYLATHVWGTAQHPNWVANSGGSRFQFEIKASVGVAIHIG